MVTLNGCTFAGCSVTFSGQAVLQSTCKDQRICDETLDYDVELSVFVFVAMGFYHFFFCTL